MGFLSIVSSSVPYSGGVSGRSACQSFLCFPKSMLPPPSPPGPFSQVRGLPCPEEPGTGHGAAGAWGPWAAIWHTLHCSSSAMTNGWRGGDSGWCHRVLCRACPSSGTWSRSWVSWLPGGSSSPWEGWLALAQCQGFWFCINHAHAQPGAVTSKVPRN